MHWVCTVHGRDDNVHRILKGKHEEKGHLRDLDIDGMLKWIFMKQVVMVCTGFI